MARKRSSNAEDIVDLVALMPWWAGVIAALAAYLILHGIAASPPPAVQPGNVGKVLPGMMMQGIASAVQYVLPLLCLIGAALSFLRRRKRNRLATEVAAATGQQVLDEMTWREFEILVGESFRMQGYGVTEIGGGGADGGVDLVLRKDDKTYLVQCKQWKTFTVSVSTVRELYGVMVHRQAQGGFVVTSGRFTADAQAFARGKNIQLIDGAQLVARVRASRSGVLPTASSVPQPEATLLCPICSSQMVRRTARKGANAGGQFWGCTRFPACRGVR